MQTKVLQPEDMNKLVKRLYDYSSRGINQQVRASYAERSGMSESTFRDKMLGARCFKGFELDLIESLYREQLGPDVFDKQVSIFLSISSDGDRRTNEDSLNREIAALSRQNEELATAHLLL